MYHYPTVFDKGDAQMGKKRWLLLFVCLALVFSGCGKADQNQPQTTPAATTPAATTAPEIPFALDQVPGKVTLWEDSFLLSGVADPRNSLTVNGKSVPVASDGSFSYNAPLEVGNQTITLEYKGEIFAFEVQRRYAVQSYAPDSKGDYHAGQTLFLQVMAKDGSQVEASFRGEVIALSPHVNQLGSGVWEGFTLYTAQVKLPQDHKEALELGSVSYRVVCDGIEERYESASIICQGKPEVLESDPEATPEGYWDVGSGFIVELTGSTVETFSGRDNNDLSRPTNNYLPAGTVDYGDITLIGNREANRTYRALRCGVRVYAQTQNKAGFRMIDSVDCYYGTLPDHNEIGISGLTIEGHHTYLTLDCLWKAPFYFDYEPQAYAKESSRRYYVEKFDARYVDITFCYADRIEGEIAIGDDHPLFKSAEVIENEADMTLRLWLKKEGGFYGWDAYYNEEDQLVFRFLNPVTVSKADNPYGADLTGVTILLDVGHGGFDMGAAGHGGWGQTYPEGELNLNLALLVKAELEKTGATVILNRTDNEMEISHTERIMILQKLAPDYCLSIHHNSSVLPNAWGHETCFYTTWSQRPAELTVATMTEADIFRLAGLRFYLYYFARQTTCPIVLTENGYLSNQEDLQTILDPSAQEAEAKALAQGVANHFLDISGLLEIQG